jgi:hypothetical protein
VRRIGVALSTASLYLSGLRLAAVRRNDQDLTPRRNRWEINRTYLSKLEKGARYPGLEIITKPATVLEV